MKYHLTCGSQEVSLRTIASFLDNDDLATNKELEKRATKIIEENARYGRVIVNGFAVKIATSKYETSVKPVYSKLSFDVISEKELGNKQKKYTINGDGRFSMTELSKFFNCSYGNLSEKLKNVEKARVNNHIVEYSGSMIDSPEIISFMYNGKRLFKDITLADASRISGVAKRVIGAYTQDMISHGWAYTRKDPRGREKTLSKYNTYYNKRWFFIPASKISKILKNITTTALTKKLKSVKKLDLVCKNGKDISIFVKEVKIYD